MVVSEIKVKNTITGTTTGRESASIRYIVSGLGLDSINNELLALNAVGWFPGAIHPLNPRLSAKDYTVNMLGNFDAEVIISYSPTDPDDPRSPNIKVLDISVNVILVNRTVTTDASGDPIEVLYAGRGINVEDPCYDNIDVQDSAIIPVEKLVPQIELTIVSLERYGGGAFGVPQTPWEKTTELTGRINSLDFLGSSRNKWLCTGVSISETISNQERNLGFDVRVTYKFRHADLALRDQARIDADWNAVVRYNNPLTGLPVSPQVGGGADCGPDLLAQGAAGNQAQINGRTEVRLYNEIDFNEYFPDLNQHPLFSRVTAQIQGVQGNANQEPGANRQSRNQNNDPSLLTSNSAVINGV